MQYCSPHWTGAPASHLAQLDSVETKAFKILKSPVMKLSQWAYHFPITDRYTYGMKVRGEARVTLSAFVFKPCEPNTECILSKYGQKEVKISNIFPEINGQVDFAFSHREIMKMLQNAFPGRMKVSVEVKEKLTGIVTKAEKWLRFSKERNRLQFVNAPRSFMPGMKYITYVQVTQYDGTPLLPKDRCMAVYVLIKETGAENRASHKNMYLCILDNGIVKISVDVQPDTNIIFIKASLLSQYTSITLFAKRHSPSDSFLQLTSNTLVAKVGKPIKVVVNGKHLPETLSYVVISRGNIIASANISQCCLHLVPRPHWSPSINILVYFVRQDSEVVNDAITLGVEGAFENKVHLTWSTLQAAPGDNVSLHVSASEARAYVGLLVVDKSVLLLKEGNDITKEKVISELSGITNHPVDHTTGMPFLRRWGSDDAASIFEEAGVAVLTNFYIPRSYERRDLIDSPRQLEVAKDGHFQEPSRIRSDFPETWIWEDSLTRANGIASITATVPDTITSWIASAFSVGPRFGLGLASPQELISFLPFFIYLDLPYSIIRGEDFLLKVVVFNYLSQDQQVAVTLKESESFELYSARQIIITVRRKEGASLAFALSPKTLGQVPMTVKAQSAHASDAITDHVLVKAEGKRRTFSKAVLIDRRSGETNVTSEILKFTYPSNMVQGSAVAYVSAVGDIMGPSIEGLQHLVQMPYGCGEQNMVKFAPNVYVLQYLEATDKSFESLRQKVISYMVRGYQRQLNYQRQDGSYSAFGDSDRSGSTWLTAFVFKCFTQASTFMFIDQHQMHRTYIWLVEQWSDDGEFQEAGRLLDAPILGASTNPVALTASVVTSLLSNPDNWDMKVKASIAYLERAVGRGIENHRDLALVTYALVLGKSEDAATALDQLNHHAILDGDVMHWPNQNPTLLHSASSIETAAYTLLAHLKLGLIEEGLPIMHWLSQQRSHLGGFVSTQDTVVALEAMSAFAIEMSRGDFNLQLTVYTTVMQNTLSINRENTLLLQKVQIPTVETLGSLTVNVQAKGTGFAILQLNVLYNVKEEMPENEPFELLVNIDDVTGEGSLHYTVHICTRRKSRVNGGMVLLEVGMLSGFSPGDINLQAAIKRVEKKKGKLFIYFNEINETMICVEILASQSTPIGKVKEANVIISDFYEPSRKTERSYKSNALEEVSICDICGDQCQDCVNT